MRSAIGPGRRNRSATAGPGARRRGSRRGAGLLAAVVAAVAFAFGPAGCQSQSTRPTRRELARVDALVSDRVGAPFDAQALLLADPRVPPPAPTGELTPDEAIERTLQHNLALVASAENLAIARAQLVQAGLIQNPVLGQNSGTLFPVSPASLATAFDVSFSEVLNSLFTQPARVAQARVQSAQAGIDLAAQAFDLAEQAQSKYQEMAHARRSLELARRVTGLYGRAVQAAEARQKVGVVPTPEVNRARLQYEDARRQVQHLQSQYARAAREMNWLMGVSTPPRWDLPAAAVDVPPSLPPPPDSDRLEELALKFRLDLRRAGLDQEVGRRGVELARRGLIPQVQLGVDSGRDNAKNYFAGPFVNVTLPVFDPGIVALRQAQAQARRFDKAYVALSGQARQDVRSAFGNWRIAAEDVQFFRERLIPQQEQNVQLMEKSFRLGNDDLDSLLNVYRDYVTARQSYEDAIQAYQDASVALQRAVGLAWARMLERAGVQPAAVPATGPATRPTTEPVMGPAPGPAPATEPAESPLPLAPATEPAPGPATAPADTR